MRVAGRDAIGLGVVMARGGNVIDLGDNLSQTMDRLQQDLPVGMDVHVFDQPQIVKTSLNLFVQHPGRGHGHRARGVLPQPRLAHRHRGGAVDPAGAGDDLPRHEASSASTCSAFRWARW
jgi:hypothetical protein